jgi:insulysin
MNDFENKYIKKTNGIYHHIKDNKNYSTVRLNNGLNVIFIENKESSKSSAYLTVNVGTNDNYENYLGIAHFLEHMLFLGSEKYPSQDAYFKFIHDNGGGSNAYTANTHTCYHFDINNEFFKEAIDIFSGFFICPLIDPKHIQSEVHAVNAEHHKNIYNQNWRNFHLQKKTLNPDHPCSKFGTGTLETLLKSGNPSEKDIHKLTNAVRKFFNEKYSSDIMNLYIYHNCVDDNFCDFIKEIFSQITKKNVTSKIKEIPIILHKNNHLKILEIEPYLKVNQISLTWIIKKNNNRKGKNISKKDISCEILSDILSHQGVNTLYNFFYEKGLVEEINMEENILTRELFMYQMTLSLTEVGINHINNIILSVFNFIKCIGNDLLNNNKYYHNYIKNYIIKLKTQFKNYTELSPDDLLEMIIIIKDIYQIDFEDIMTEYVNITHNINYHIKTLYKLLQQLEPQYCTISKVLYGVKIKNPNIDEFYGVKYKLSSDLIGNYYGLAESCNFIPIDYGFITEKLLNIPVYSGGGIQKYDSPHNIYIDNANPFKDDKIRISVEITPYESLNKGDPNLYLYLIVYSAYINIKYNAVLYDLNSNMVNQNISTKGERIDFSIVCYPNMADKCINMIIKMLKTTNTDDHHKINRIFQSLIDELHNKLKKEPYIQLEYDILYNFLKKYCFRPEILLSAINKFISSKTDIKIIGKTAHNLLKTASINALISGNITEDIGKRIAKKINNISIFKKVEIEDYVNDVPPKIKRINSLSDDPNMACCILYELESVKYDLEDWDKKTCITMILENIIKTIYFDELRTKGKLGYIASTRLVNINLRGSLQKYYIKLCIQSNINSQELANKSIKVINDIVREKIKKMSSDEFTSLKSGIISELQSIPLNIEQRDLHIEKCISCFIKKDGTVDYDYKNKLINALNNLNKTDIELYFIDMFITNPKITQICIDAKLQKN